MTRNSRRSYLNEVTDNLDAEPDDNSMSSSDLSDDTELTSLDALLTKPDDAVVTFKDLAEALDEKSNTISARWFPEKVLPAFEGVQCPSLFTSNGKRIKPTGFGAKATIRYVQQCIRGGRSWESWRAEILDTYAADRPVPPVVEAELVEQSLESSAITYLQDQGQKFDGGPVSEDALQLLAALTVTVRSTQSLNQQAEDLEAKSIEDQAFQEALAEELEKAKQEQIKAQAKLKAKKIVNELRKKPQSDS